MAAPRVSGYSNGYRYNLQTAFALVPALLVLAGFGGQVVMGTFMVGGMITYILDALQYREGSFAALWITLVAANLGLLISNATFSPLRLLGVEWLGAGLGEQDRAPLLSLIMLLTGGQSLLLTGCWATLQFKWVTQQYPVVAFAVEKLVMQAAVPVGAAVQAWGLVASVGASHAPFYLMPMMCVMYKMFCLPLPSSFPVAAGAAAAAAAAAGGGGAASKPSYGSLHSNGAAPVELLLVQSRPVAAISASLVVLLPAGLYLALHAAVIWGSWDWVHAWSLLLLLSLPTLWICVLEEGLWWLSTPSSSYSSSSSGGGGGAHVALPPGVQLLRKLVALVSLAAAVASIEGRVVFVAFEQFINLHPPWSYIIITAAMFGGASVVVLHFTGALDASIGGVVLVLSAAGGCLATGVPVYVIPAPLCAAAGVSLFYESRGVRDYALFVLGTVFTAAWFCHHHFWFLQIDLGTYTVRQMCSLLVAILLPSVFVPGLLISDANAISVTALLGAQAFLVCIAEEHLFAGAHGEQQMYPAYMVVLTSALGAAVVSRAAALGKLERWGGWVCKACYAAKLSMLAVPEAYMVKPAVLIALAVTAPLELYDGGSEEKDLQEPRKGASVVAVAATRRRGRSAAKMKPWQGVLHAAAVVVAVGAGRFTIFDAVSWMTASRPSEAVAAGALLMAAGLGCVPLLRRHFPSNEGARGAVIGACSLAMLLFLLRPPFPARLGAKCPHLPFGLCPRLWDEAHAPYHEVDDLAIYGTGESRRSHRPLWLLVAAVSCGALALLPGARQGLPGGASGLLPFKLMVAAVSGSCVAGFVGLEFFRRCFALQLVLWGGMLLASAAVVLLQAPSTPEAAGGALTSAAVWMLSFPLAVLLESSSPLPHLPKSAQRLFPDTSLDVDTERHGLRRAELLGVFAAQAVLLAFVIKLRIPSLQGAGALSHRPPLDEDGNDVADDGDDDDFDDVPISSSFLGSGGKRRAASGLSGGVSLPFPSLAAGRAGCFGMGGPRLGFSGNNPTLQWASLTGNVLTVLAFALALVLSLGMAGPQDASIFVIAPLLLLLNRDDLLLSGLVTARRYFAPAAAVVVYLGANAANQVMDVVLLPEHDRIHLLHIPGSPWWYFFRNLLCLVACMPTHAAFLKYLWDWLPQADGQLLVMTPLNLMSLCLTDMETTRLLAVLAMVVTCLQQLAMRQQNRRAMRVI